MRFDKFIHNNMIQISLLNKFSNITLGTTRSFIYNDNTALLSNIYIRPKFQHQGFGSQLLSESETALKSLHITSIHLLAWLPNGSTHVLDFYQKNGYVFTDDHIDIYDDYTQLYDLVKLHKQI